MIYAPLYTFLAWGKHLHCTRCWQQASGTWRGKMLTTLNSVSYLRSIWRDQILCLFTALWTWEEKCTFIKNKINLFSWLVKPKIRFYVSPAICCKLPFFCFFVVFFNQFLSLLSVYSITSKVYIPKAFTVKEKTGRSSSCTCVEQTGFLVQIWPISLKQPCLWLAAAHKWRALFPVGEVSLLAIRAVLLGKNIF